MLFRWMEWRKPKIQIRFVLLGAFLLSFQLVTTRYYYGAYSQRGKSPASFAGSGKGLYDNSSDAEEQSAKRSEEHVVIVTVICGSKSEFKEMATVMMKSAIIFKGESRLTFVIFADFDLQADLHTRLQTLQSKAPPSSSFSYDLRNTTFPDDGYDGQRKVLEGYENYRPGSLLRLYLPVLVTDYPNALYVDVDVIFLNELSDTWQLLQQMNDSQIAAVSPDHADQKVNPYKERQKHVIPFYGNTGLNAGVMLMRLEKMREMKWVDEVNAILKNDLKLLDVFDQDIINIFFHNHPDKLYFNSCRYNYVWYMSLGNSALCMEKSLCIDAHLKGVSILHGHSKAFVWSFIFKSIYESFRDYELGTDILTSLIEPLKKRLEMNACFSLEKEFTQNLDRLIDNNHVLST